MFLVKYKIVQKQASLYPPELAPCDFFTFSKLKMHSKSKNVMNVKNVKENAMSKDEKLAGISKLNATTFQKINISFIIYFSLGK